MGYGNPSLDEISTRNLLEELIRRQNQLTRLLCPYCNQSLGTHTCKFKDQVAEVYGTTKSFKEQIDLLSASLR